jgi:PAS domain S-box-containing protein
MLDHRNNGHAIADTSEILLVLLESSADGLVVIDHTGEIVLVNRRTEEMFGYPREELIGQPVEILVPPTYAKRHVRDRGSYFARPGPRPMGRGIDLWGQRRDGTQFPVEISLVPLETEQGRFAGAMIRDLVDAVHHGRRLMTLLSDIGEELGSYIGSRRGPRPGSLLTPREHEVLTLAAQGLSAREISRRLTVSPSTVKTHLEHIYAKLGASDRAAAIAQAMRAGLLH